MSLKKLSLNKVNKMKTLSFSEFVQGFKQYKVSCFSKKGLEILYKHFQADLPDNLNPEHFNPLRIKEVFAESTPYEVIYSFGLNIDDNQPSWKFRPLVINALNQSYDYIGETEQTIIHFRSDYS
jgi:hypothetical protein